MRLAAWIVFAYDYPDVPKGWTGVWIVCDLCYPPSAALPWVPDVGPEGVIPLP